MGMEKYAVSILSIWSSLTQYDYDVLHYYTIIVTLPIRKEVAHSENKDSRIESNGLVEVHDCTWYRLNVMCISF